jgi:anti-sigma B factor antagonist
MVVQFVTRQHGPDVTVMDFTGQLTWGNSLVEAEYAIKDRIQGGSRKLVLDFTNVNFLDSAGVGMLVVCSSVMQQAGGRLVLAGVAGKVKQVLEITHINKVIGMYPDLTSACDEFARHTVQRSDE